MRLGTKVIAVLVALTALLIQRPVNALPYDPYPWCANYESKGFGGQNCGFSTWNQCMATVSGIGGFCVPNQFYNQAMRPPGEQKKDDTNSCQGVPSDAAVINDFFIPARPCLGNAF